jgi:hypothetical protein
MGKRLDVVGSHANDLSEFQHALGHIKKVTTSAMPDTNVTPATPGIKRTTSLSKSAFTPALKLKPSQTLKLPSSVQDALRYANVPFNHDSINALRETLKAIQLERQQKLQESYDSSCTSVHGTLAERMSRMDAEQHAILSSLMLHTEYKEVHLTDPKIEDELRRLEKDLNDANEQLLVAEVNQLSLDDPKVRAFVTKYGK